MKNWTDKIKPEDLPEPLREIAAEIGIEATLTLSEEFGGGEIYLPQATSVIAAAKRRFILDNPKMRVRDLRRKTKYSDRQILRIRNKEEDERVAALQESLQL